MAISGWVLCGRERLVRVVIVGRWSRWTPWSTNWWVIILIIILVNNPTSCSCSRSCSSAGLDERDRFSVENGSTTRSPGMLVACQKGVPSPALSIFFSFTKKHRNHNTKKNHKPSKCTTNNQSNITLLLGSTCATIQSTTIS